MGTRLAQFIVALLLAGMALLGFQLYTQQEQLKQLQAIVLQVQAEGASRQVQQDVASAERTGVEGACFIRLKSGQTNPLSGIVVLVLPADASFGVSYAALGHLSSSSSLYSNRQRVKGVFDRDLEQVAKRALTGATTGVDGRFKARLPPGRYKLATGELLPRQLITWCVPFDVREGALTSVDLSNGNGDITAIPGE